MKTNFQALCLIAASGILLYAKTTFAQNNVGIGTASPTQKLDVNGNGIRIQQSRTIAASSTACNQGEIAWDANYVYVCVSANSWRRSALASW